MNKILVVDNDLDSHFLMHFILTKHHYEVRLISNSQDITTTIKSFKPDLIILDVYIGKVDGREICKELKQSEETKSIPVILYSNSKPTELHYACHAQAFVAKPFDILELINTINILIKPEHSGLLIKQLIPNMKKDLSFHYSELECAKTHLLSCETIADIENAETWIRIINLDIDIINARNVVFLN